jgi:hemolysin type calcium binding protein
VTIADQFAYGNNQADAAINRIVFSDGVTGEGVVRDSR